MNNYVVKLQRKVKKYTRRYAERPKTVAWKMVWWSLGQLLRPTQSKISSFRDGILHVLFRPMGGVGDHVYSLKYFYCFSKAFSSYVSIDVCLEGKDKDLVAIYEQQSYISNVIVASPKKRYDIDISVVRLPVINSFDDSRVLELGSESLQKYVGLLKRFHMENLGLYESDVLGRLYTMTQMRVRENQADIEGTLHMSAVDDFKLNRPETPNFSLKKYGIQGEYIVIQAGAGRHFKEFKCDTRQWPVESYNKLIGLIKRDQPNLLIVQLGEKHHDQISGVDIQLVGKTSLSEVIAILDQAKFLISAEGGYAIMRHFFSSKKSCVLFGPTDRDFFCFKNNINLSANNCVGCEWVVEHWNRVCLRSGSEPVCMYALTPQFVYDSIREEIQL